MKKTHLLMIDPQNDFCDPKGALYVSGGESDMDRLSKFISNNGSKIDDIHCSIDSHQSIHVAHPLFWVNSKNEHPKPFTLISYDDVKNGVWRTFNPQWQKRGLSYVESLHKNSRYVLCIWNPHCLIGTWGHSFFPSVATALVEWESKNFGRVNFVPKGNNIFTEHYSILQADVPDDSDPTTKLNTDLLDVLKESDEILITGEALSHCTNFSVRDIADNFGDDNVKKFVLLKDTCSPVPGFESNADQFVKDMTKRGMQVTTTKDWN